jgi:hypothetical protein
MVYEAAMSGLIVDRKGLEDQPLAPDPRNTLKGFWRVMEYLPIEHRSYKDPDSVTVRYV